MQLHQDRMKQAQAVLHHQQAHREAAADRTARAVQETDVAEKETREEKIPVSRIRTVPQDRVKAETAVLQDRAKARTEAQDQAKTEKTEEDFLREDLRADREEAKETEAVTVVSAADRTAPDSAREEERAAVPGIWYLHRSLQKLPRTASVSVTEKIKIKRKILRRPREAEEDLIRGMAVRDRDFQKLFRSRLLHQSRRKRSRRLRKSLFRRK